MTKKKRQKRVLAAVAALALLGLVYFLVSRADWEGEEEEATEELSVLTVAPAEISEAAIINSYGTMYLSYDVEIRTPRTLWSGLYRSHTARAMIREDTPGIRKVRIIS